MGLNDTWARRPCHNSGTGETPVIRMGETPMSRPDMGETPVIRMGETPMSRPESLIANRQSPVASGSRRFRQRAGWRLGYRRRLDGGRPARTAGLFAVQQVPHRGLVQGSAVHDRADFLA